MKSTKQVFISYASEDHGKAKQIHDDLKREGIDAWFDKETLLPGQNWEYEIRQAIKNSQYFIALLSSSSVSKSGYVQKELRMALDALDKLPESEIFVIPARLDKCQPTHEKLTKLHWVDLFPSYEKGMKQILRVLKPEKDPDDRMSLVVTTPDRKRFEAEVLSDTLVDQVLRDFLACWRTTADERRLLRYELHLADSGGARLSPDQTLSEASPGGKAKLALVPEILTPESAIRLFTENEQGERFETFVLLSTRIEQLSNAFMQNERGENTCVTVELLEDGVDEAKRRRLNPGASLYEERVGDNALLCIHRAR